MDSPALASRDVLSTSVLEGVRAGPLLEGSVQFAETSWDEHGKANVLI